MERTLNRKLIRWWIFFMMASLFFALLLFFAGGGAVVFSLLTIICLVIGAVLMLITNRCPHCKEGFRGGEWSKPHAGYCRKCGKLMEYDDTVATRNRKKERYE